MRLFNNHSLVIFFWVAPLFLPQMLFAATLEIAPAAVAVREGDAVVMSIFVASVDRPLNAVSGTMLFPTDLLQAVSIRSSDSILTLWVDETSFSNDTGAVKWSGIVPNPGFTGSRGKILSIEFRAKRAGTAVLGFTTPQVLANDGKGTDILKLAKSATILISASAIPVASTPPQTSEISSATSFSDSTSSSVEVPGVVANSRNVFSPLILGGVLTLALGFLAGLLIGRYPRMTRSMRKAKRVESDVHRRFEKFLAYIAEERQVVKTLSDKKDIDPHEQGILKKLDDELGTAEHFIEDKVQAIEKDVHLEKT